MIDSLIGLFHSKSGVVLLMTYAVLMLATLIITLVKTYKTPELIARIQSWWWIISLFTLGVMLNNTLALFFFGLVSYLALKEYFTLIPSRRADRRIIFYAYLAIIIQYLFAHMQWYGMFIIWIPVYLFLFLPFCQVLNGETQGFLANTSRIHWGLMMFVFGLSHLAYLLNLTNPSNNLAITGTDLVLYVVLLTEANDILQYLWGKRFGKHKIVPKVSPNKTVEGFIGAFMCTTLLALFFSFLTPFEWYQALLVGMLISSAGFIGDVVISMIKREVNVKDSGSLLPGHGGILDRVDSLTYTAPLFFHYVYYLYY
ncbi:phosphatidate cytidylyltransferase [Thiofilum flexile]|uniref:phosphatidate cytidylyltransferase n=1 Tax=Thiofilum flexile TaxID=125627 RepID=UPI000365BD1C|nr:phosphatidate cytidylyltransferase [Thiofilum flexile]